jgi:hypothetical protein
MDSHIKEFLKLKYPKLTPNSSVVGYYDIDDNTGKTLAHISKECHPQFGDNLLHIHLSQIEDLMNWFSINKRIARIHIQNHIHEMFETKSVDELRSRFQTIY